MDLNSSKSKQNALQERFRQSLEKNQPKSGTNYPPSNIDKQDEISTRKPNPVNESLSIIPESKQDHTNISMVNDSFSQLNPANQGSGHNPDIPRDNNKIFSNLNSPTENSLLNTNSFKDNKLQNIISPKNNEIKVPNNPQNTGFDPQMTNPDLKNPHDNHVVPNFNQPPHVNHQPGP